MKIYKTQAEVDADIKDDVLAIEGDVSFKFSLKIEASIDVKAGNIEAENIKAWDIKAWNINAWDINAWDIEAGNIEAENIKAWDIRARNIKAWDISFYAVAFAYVSFKCRSIVGLRDNSKYFCLDKDVEIIQSLEKPK